MTTPSRVDKARGLLFGLALGDCLGAFFEGHSGVTDADVLAAERRDAPLVHTDDTALALVLARHLSHRRTAGRGKTVDADALALDLARAWQDEPWRGYGAGVTTSFRLVLSGTPWPAAARAVFEEGSFGNGGAMRVAPVALVGEDVRDVADLARRSTEVTHAHTDAVRGAVCLGVAAHLALRLAPADEVPPRRFVDSLREAVPSASWDERLKHVLDLTTGHVEPEEAARVLGNDVSAAGSVPLALLAFLRNQGAPMEAIRYAVRAGGDTDTIAAMAGAVAGAHSGFGALPAAVTGRLEAAQELHLYADHLA